MSPDSALLIWPMISTNPRVLPSASWTEIEYLSSISDPFLVGFKMLTKKRRSAVPERDALMPELARASTAATVSFIEIPAVCAAGPA
ncbi:hypothetical protein D3C85_1393560 [compost metagenome]